MDLTQAVGKAINDRLQKLREEDPGIKEVAGYLELSDSGLGRFYLLPKIHKGPSSVDVQSSQTLVLRQNM